MGNRSAETVGGRGAAYKIKLMDWDTPEKLERRAERVVENTRALMEDLVAVRKQHGLSQVELADRMGVSQSAVAQLERYDANPTIASIERYAIAVGARVAITVVSDRDGWVPIRKGRATPLKANAKLRSGGFQQPASAWTPPTMTEL